MNTDKSDTPRTDAVMTRLTKQLMHGNCEGLESFARDLERQRDHAIKVHCEAVMYAASLEKQNKELTRQVAELLDHCHLEGGECSVCAAIVCPHKCEFHLHHDGCPACAEDGEGEEIA